MKNRISAHPGRVMLTPVPGNPNLYDMQRADEPSEPGTPLNAATLISDSTAELLGLIPADATPDGGFRAALVKIGERALKKSQTFETSGTFTAPMTGTYTVTCIGGGESGLVGRATKMGQRPGTSGATRGIAGGNGGHYVTATVYLLENQKVSVIVGSGGAKKPGRYMGSGESNAGGKSSFGKFTSAPGGVSTNNNSRYSGGSGTDDTVITPAEYIMGGGGANFDSKGQNSALNQIPIDTNGGGKGAYMDGTYHNSTPGTKIGCGGGSGVSFVFPYDVHDLTPTENEALSGAAGYHGAVIVEWEE